MISSLKMLLMTCALFSICILFGSASILDSDNNRKNIDTLAGLKLSFNLTTGDSQIYVGDQKWFENTDVIVHRNQKQYSQSNGTLIMSSVGPTLIEGSDVIGDFIGMDIEWSASFEESYSQKTTSKSYGENFLVTHALSYSNDVIVFSQIYSAGLSNASLGLSPESINKVKILIFIVLVISVLAL